MLRVILRIAGGAAVGLLLLSSALAAEADASMGTAESAATAASSSGLPLRRVGEPALPTGGIGVSGLILLGALATVTVGWAIWRQRRVRANGLSPLRQLLGSPRDGVNVVQSVRLTPHASVHVIEWNGRQHLLACGESAVTALADREGPPVNPVSEGRR